MLNTFNFKVKTYLVFEAQLEVIAIHASWVKLHIAFDAALN